MDRKILLTILATLTSLLLVLVLLFVAQIVDLYHVLGINDHMVALLAGLGIIFSFILIVGVVLSLRFTEYTASNTNFSDSAWKYFRAIALSQSQTILAILVVVVIAILIYVDKVDPDAGLPIISAAVGFALGKGTGEKENPPEKG